VRATNQRAGIDPCHADSFVEAEFDHFMPLVFRVPMIYTRLTYFDCMPELVLVALGNLEQRHCLKQFKNSVKLITKPSVA
jgi:hypothetical protein